MKRTTLIMVIASLLTICSSFAQQWQGIYYYPGYVGYTNFQTPAVGDELAEFSFPNYTQHANFPAFLVYYQSSPMNLNNSTITCQINVETSDGAAFVYGGQGVWNLGPTPPHTRLFFSTVRGYNNDGPETNFWFCNSPSASVAMTNCAETTTLTATLDHYGDWADGFGRSPTNAFWYAVGNVREIGICFGGGSFYDIGVAMFSGDGIFHLRSFEINPSYRLNITDQITNCVISVTKGLETSIYKIEQSDDLVNWKDFGIIQGTNVLAVTNGGYYRGVIR